jgi:hypothetical protein
MISHRETATVLQSVCDSPKSQRWITGTSQWCGHVTLRRSAFSLVQTPPDWNIGGISEWIVGIDFEAYDSSSVTT